MWRSGVQDEVLALAAQLRGAFPEATAAVRRPGQPEARRARYAPDDAAGVCDVTYVQLAPDAWLGFETASAPAPVDDAAAYTTALLGAYWPPAPTVVAAREAMTSALALQTRLAPSRELARLLRLQDGALVRLVLAALAQHNPPLYGCLDAADATRLQVAALFTEPPAAPAAPAARPAISVRDALRDVLAETAQQLSPFQPHAQLFEMVFSAQVVVVLLVVLFAGRGVFENARCLLATLGAAAAEASERRLLSRAALLVARTAEVLYASLPEPARRLVEPLGDEGARRLVAAVLTLMWELLPLAGVVQLGGAETVASALRVEERAYAEPCGALQALCAALRHARALESARALVAECGTPGLAAALQTAERQEAVRAWLAGLSPRPLQRLMAWCPALTARLGGYALAMACAGTTEPAALFDAILRAESPVLYEAYRACVSPA
jgi:hypothetical protein